MTIAFWLLLWTISMYTWMKFHYKSVFKACGPRLSNADIHSLIFFRFFLFSWWHLSHIHLECIYTSVCVFSIKTHCSWIVNHLHIDKDITSERLKFWSISIYLMSLCRVLFHLFVFIHTVMWSFERWNQIRLFVKCIITSDLLSRDLLSC